MLKLWSGSVSTWWGRIEFSVEIRRAPFIRSKFRACCFGTSVTTAQYTLFKFITGS